MLYFRKFIYISVDFLTIFGRYCEQIAHATGILSNISANDIQLRTVITLRTKKDMEADASQSYAGEKVNPNSTE